jgi:RNA polymerase sigma-70 factor (ECF subfamily)
MSISCTKGHLYTTTSTARQIPDLPDKALIRSIVAGDKSAMRILFARHNVRVYRFLLRFVSDKSTADDLVSELFLDVWRQAAKFQARSQVSTWLLAIARNKALAVLRRRSTEELDEEQAAALEDPGNNPEVAMENRQKTEILLKCLRQLSPTHREVIDLVSFPKIRSVRIRTVRENQSIIQCDVCDYLPAWNIYRRSAQVAAPA